MGVLGGLGGGFSGRVDLLLIRLLVGLVGCRLVIVWLFWCECWFSF